MEQVSLIAKVAAIAAGVAVLWVMHRNRDRQDFDLADIFMDGGRISARKFYEAGAFFLTSIWFVFEIIHDRADLTDMLAFSGLWAAVRTAGQINHLRLGKGDENGGAAS